jgi:hypothetical protein
MKIALHLAAFCAKISSKPKTTKGKNHGEG